MADGGELAPRVLHMMAGADKGGAEAFFVRLCAALAGADVAQCIVMRPNPTREQALEAAGLKPFLAPYRRRFDGRTRRVIKAATAGFRPDIVLAYMSRAGQYMPDGPWVKVGRLGGYYDLKYFHNCDFLICNTNDLIEHVVRGGWPRDKVRLVNNFVEDRRELPANRKLLRTPDDAPLIFALGRFHDDKAFDTLLEAVAMLSDDTYLWLAGEGPLGDDLKAQAKSLGIDGRVRFLGWRDDPAPYYAAADVFVVPSRFEPLGNVVIEGWAQEKPVVAAASQGPSQLVRDEMDGLLVPVDDATAMARAIERLIGNRTLAAALARAGRTTYESNYTEAAAVNAYLKLFRDLMKQRHGR